MKISKFTNESVIAGAYILNQTIQDETSKRLKALDVSYLAALIITALYFERKDTNIGPARLASSLKFSRSRVSQELSKLEREKILSREISRLDSRGFNLKLTAKGEKLAASAIKVFNGIQKIVDSAIGEKNAENLNADLLKIAETFKSALASR